MNTDRKCPPGPLTHYMWVAKSSSRRGHWRKRRTPLRDFDAIQRRALLHRRLVDVDLGVLLSDKPEVPPPPPRVEKLRREDRVVPPPPKWPPIDNQVEKEKRYYEGRR